jgi:alcohol dehydrogenase class IV
VKMMRFEFATATRILFGKGTINQSGKAALELGKKALIVTGASTVRCKPLLDQLIENGLNYRLFSVSGEPTVSMVEKGKLFAIDEKCDVIIGFGGGSALDAGKAVAALAANPGDIFAYMETIGNSKPLREPSLPYIAIPTTAGTGAEVTRNAVLGSKEHQVKVSLRSPTMLPRLAVVDPQLTYDLPERITAFSGMDALSQLIEPFVSIKSNPITDSFCREGIKRIAKSLEKAFINGADFRAREDMSLASLLSGMALANSKLGAVHGFAGPIGGMYDAPHGAICACFLTPVTSVNINALQERHPQSNALKRYHEISQILTGDQSAGLTDCIEWMRDITNKLDIPSLGNWGILEKDFEAIIEKAAVASSMAGNPIELTAMEMNEILKLAS